MSHSLARLPQAFNSLRIPLLGFERCLSEDERRLRQLDDIRVDSGVTQLFINLDRTELVTRVALASTAVIQIKALLALGEGSGF